MEVIEIADGGTGVLAQTKDGPTIGAKYLVLATGYELMDIVPSATHTVISTYALATKPQKATIWPGESFIWEASDPYLYVRTTADGRAICGGEDEAFENETKRDALLPEKIVRVSAKLKKLFPQLDTTADFAWTGCFGTTSTGLPYTNSLAARQLPRPLSFSCPRYAVKPS